MAYFECIIGSGSATAIPLIVTCSSRFAGTTITASKTGARTQTQTCPSSSPYEVTFILPEDGTWIISGVVSGQTFSETVTILPYEANLNDIPEGSTVLPTDDIQTWLHCSNIWDKSYTTVSEVLNDATTVTILIASNNAVDYMVRSTTWASAVCADSSAMTKIGANDYCADTLLSDSTWFNAICDSAYFESVLTTKVPTMTSNTAPSGQVIGTPINSLTPIYQAFDGNNSTHVSLYTASGASGEKYIGYVFTSPVKVNKLSCLFSFDGTPGTRTWNWTLQGSNDGNTWTDLESFTASASQNNISIDVGNSTKYQYYRIRTTDILWVSGSYSIKVSTLQFYGRD